MLHILLFILKITCIILLVILGILVLLVCIVLFVPIRYEISGRCEENLDTLKVKMTFTWLLHLFRADVYFKNGVFKWRSRTAWKKKVQGQENPAKSTSKKTEVDSDEGQYKKAQQIVEEKETISEESEKGSKEPGTSGKEADKEKAGFFLKIKMKIRALSEKKEKLQDFLTDEIHIDAFKKTKKELVWFLRRLNPQIAQADILFGFDDPCKTGQVLAGLGILYPVIAWYVNITPDFEHEILKGTFYIKGKIRLSVVTSLLRKLIWSKNIRMTYKDIKCFEL